MRCKTIATVSGLDKSPRGITGNGIAFPIEKEIFR